MTSNQCPVCNEYLDGGQDGTFLELYVGLSSPPLMDSLNNITYSEPEHTSIGHKIVWALGGCAEILRTHLVQVDLEVQRARSSHQSSEARRIHESKMSSELKQRCQSLEHKACG